MSILSNDILDQPAPGSQGQPAMSGDTRRAQLHLRLQLATACAAMLPPFVGSRLRVQALRAAGFKLGRGVIMWGTPTIVGSGDIYSRLTIGPEAGFNVGCLFELEDTITIGKSVAVGHQVMFLTRTYDTGPAGQRAGQERREPIVIGDGTWIGARCIIMPGVTIGAGSVIAAGMVITKDIPPDSLIIGAQKISLARWR